MEEDCDILSLAINSIENDADLGLSEDQSSVENKLCTHLSTDETESPRAGASKENVNNKVRALIGVDLCFQDEDEIQSIQENLCPKKNNDMQPVKSFVHSGDTDSSDDEDNKYFEETKYDSFGKFIKNKIKNTEKNSTSFYQESSWKKNVSVTDVKLKNALKETKTDVSADPIFNIRIVNPLASSQIIKEKMIGRTPITFGKIKSHVSHGDLKNDWVIAAVLVKKLPSKVSQNGNNYSSWILSDLKSDLKTVLLFLFGKAHQELWKTSVGTVLAILNPSALSDKKSSEFEAKISIKSPDQVMIWGRSKDLGQCKVVKKNGEVCGSFVNSNACEVCVYHVKQEYNKCRARPEFSSEGNVGLRNKVLGKNEVFYGGKSFTAIPERKKTSVKDVSRLKGLGTIPAVVPEVVYVPNLQRSTEILKLLPSVNNPLDNMKASDKKILDKLSSKSNRKESDRISPANDTLSKSEVKLNVTCLSNPCSPQITNAKSKIPGLVLPILSNPETEFLTEKESSTFKNSVNKSVRSGRKSAVSDSKKDKRSLQKRFNSLLDIKPTVKDETSLHQKHVNQDVSSFCDKPAEKKATKQDFYVTSCHSIVERRVSNYKPRENISMNEACSVSRTNVISDEVLNNSSLPSTPTRVISDEILKSSNCTSTPTILSDGKRSLTGSHTPNLVISKAKMKALLYVKAQGPISKENPTKGKNGSKGIKRPFPSEEDEDDTKKSVLSERFIQLMNQKSLHEDLIELREHEHELEYFEKMEKRDRLEEKMLNTFKVDCKAVKCLKCNYLWFSAAEACKAEGHPLKVIDAVKRFFKCGKCENRTVSLTIIPLLPCKKCSNTNWIRTAMIRSNVAKNDTLSIRGGEQKFMNSVVTNASLNLMVPED